MGDGGQGAGGAHVPGIQRDLIRDGRPLRPWGDPARGLPVGIRLLHVVRVDAEVGEVKTQACADRLAVHRSAARIARA